MIFRSWLCFYCVNIDRKFRSSRAAVIDGCCVTAALKQAEPSRSEQNQATQPEPDGSFRSLKTRTRTRTETRNTSWIKEFDPTRKLPGPNPDWSPSVGTLEPEWSRLSTRVGLLLRRLVFLFVQLEFLGSSVVFSRVSSPLAARRVRVFRWETPGRRACCSPAVLLLPPGCFHEEGAALLRLLLASTQMLTSANSS